MADNNITSFREIAMNSDISPTTFATAMKDDEYLSEKYVRKIEEAYNLSELFFDLEESIIENDVYTLNSFIENKSLFKIKNTHGFKDCFYIHLLEDDFYEKESYLLFENIDNKDMKTELGKIYLVKYDNKIEIAKSMVIYFINYKKEKYQLNDINILAKLVRAEV